MTDSYEYAGPIEPGEEDPPAAGVHQVKPPQIAELIAAGLPARPPVPSPALDGLADALRPAVALLVEMNKALQAVVPAVEALGRQMQAAEARRRSADRQHRI